MLLPARASPIQRADPRPGSAVRRRRRRVVPTPNRRRGTLPVIRERRFSISSSWVAAMPGRGKQLLCLGGIFSSINQLRRNSAHPKQISDDWEGQRQLFVQALQTVFAQLLTSVVRRMRRSLAAPATVPSASSSAWRMSPISIATGDPSSRTARGQFALAVSPGPAKSGVSTRSAASRTPACPRVPPYQSALRCPRIQIPGFEQSSSRPGDAFALAAAAVAGGTMRMRWRTTRSFPYCGTARANRRQWTVCSGNRMASRSNRFASSRTLPGHGFCAPDSHRRLSRRMWRPAVVLALHQVFDQHPADPEALAQRRHLYGEHVQPV